MPATTVPPIRSGRPRVGKYRASVASLPWNRTQRGSRCPAARSAVTAGAILLLATMVLAACGATPSASGSSARTVHPLVHGHGDVAGRRVVAGMTWSLPTSVTSASALDQVSCTSPSFCMAVDAQGSAYRFDGSAWSPAVPLAGSAAAAGSTTGGSGVRNGGAGTSANGTPGVSCAASTFCVALSGQSNVVQWDGTAWGAAEQVGGAASLQAVSCASTTFCVAMDGIGDGYAYEGSAWTGPTNAYGGSTDVSCVSPTFCMSASGGPSQWTGDGWTQPGSQDNQAALVSVSCARATFCVAGDSGGNVLTWNGSTWAGPTQVDHAPAGSGAIKIESISCTSATFCVAADSAGRLLGWNGSRWSAPVALSGGASFTSISCTGTSFCMAVTTNGSAVLGRPHT